MCYCFFKVNFFFIRNVFECVVIGFFMICDIIVFKNFIEEGFKGKYIGFFCVVVVEEFGG